MTTTTRTLMGLFLAGATLALAACGSSSSGGSSSPSTSTTPATTMPGTTAASQGATSAAKNLVVNTSVRAQLLAAGAALHQLPVADYTGLVPKETYYAYDPATNTYWAGAGLVASKKSTKAQIGDQDDGAYLVFDRPAAGTWRAHDAGIPGDNHFTCSIVVPAGVLTVWHWTPGNCHPPAA
jgi:hypothetical protein